MPADRQEWWEPDLSTERLTGRPATASDASLLAQIFGDQAAARYLSLQGGAWSNGSIARITERIAAHWTAHGFGPYLWFEGSEFAGYAGLKFKLIDGAAAIELMYGAPPSMQGRGLMFEAAKAALDAGSALGYSEVSIVALPENAASCALAERLGFNPTDPVEYDGMMLSRYFYRY